MNEIEMLDKVLNEKNAAIAALRAENARLRDALEKVSKVMYNIPLMDLGAGDTTQGQSLIREIRRALEANHETN